jgi:hypothetical protein
LRGLLRALTNDVLDQAARERALLVDYLNQEAALAPGQMALVDVGWQGSLQKALGRLIAQLGRNVRMRGIYSVQIQISGRYRLRLAARTAGSRMRASRPRDSKEDVIF